MLRIFVARVFGLSCGGDQTHQPVTQADPQHAAAVIVNSNRIAGRLVVQLMVFKNVRVHASRREVKHSVGREDEDASLSIFGERRGDIT